MLELARPQPLIEDLSFTTKKKCLESYKNFMCRYNFPACKPDEGVTVPMCVNDCLEFHETCGLRAGDCTKADVFEGISDECEEI